MKNRRAPLLLFLTLTFSAPAHADDFGDMFGFMFRMMFTMMDAMSDVMDDDSDDWRGPNTYILPGYGMGGVPGYGVPGYGVGGVPGYGGYGGHPGAASQWAPNQPYYPSANNAQSYCGDGYNRCGYRGQYQPQYQSQYQPQYQQQGGYGYQAQPVATPLNGQWVGNSGEILEVSGDRFRLRSGKNAVTGTLQANSNVVNLYTPQTGAVTQYIYARNQDTLILKDASGKILNFQEKSSQRKSKKPSRRSPWVF